MVCLCLTKNASSMPHWNLSIDLLFNFILKVTPPALTSRFVEFILLRYFFKYSYFSCSLLSTQYQWNDIVCTSTFYLVIPALSVITIFLLYHMSYIIYLLELFYILSLYYIIFIWHLKHLKCCMPICAKQWMYIRFTMNDEMHLLCNYTDIL